MNAVAGWLAPGIGVGSAALAVTLQPGLLVPILVTGAALGGLPLLLIVTLALVVVYSREPSRRDAAERVLDPTAEHPAPARPRALPSRAAQLAPSGP